MAADNDIAILGRLEIFRAMNHEQLRLLAFGSDHISVQSHKNLFNQGDNAHCAYVILDGRFNLYREQSGHRQLIEIVGNGTLLSEMALITQTQRNVSAIAAQHSRILQINRKIFYRLLDEYPETAQQIYDYIRQKVSDMAQNILRLTPNR